MTVERRALLAAFGLILIWGANFSVQKAVFAAVSPGGFLFVRYLMMPACAVVLVLHTFGGRFPRVSRADFWTLARLGIAGHLLHVGMVTYGIFWSTAFSSSLILACGPIFTLMILRAMGIEHLTKGQIAGVAVACVGVLVFLSEKLTSGHWQATGGDLFLLVASSFFSYYTVAAKPMIEKHGGVLVMSYALFFGSVPLVLLTLPAGIAVDWRAVSPAIWAGLLYAVMISAFMGWLVWGWVNSVRGVGRTAPLMYMMPPVAGAVAWIVGAEHFTATKLVGAAVTLAGVALAQFTGGPRDPVREEPAPVD